MAEYIDRDAALNFEVDSVLLAPGALQPFMDGMAFYADHIKRIPAADVVSRDCYDRLLAENDELRKERPVVRCADCRYNITPDKLYARCNFNYAIGPQDFFCKAGERKDGDGE